MLTNQRQWRKIHMLTNQHIEVFQMNQFKKIAYRSFQAVLNPAVAVIPYRNPKILTSVNDIPGYLKAKHKKTVLIVTDEGVHQMGLLDSLKKGLKDKQIHYYIYDKTVPNPTVKNVEAARAIYKETGCQALIGFGGGSSIDCAKTVAARIVRPRKSIRKMRGILQVLRPTPLIIAVPTTAGTGSETTVTTVITDSETGHKFPISDPVLIPHVAVHDPEVTKTLPGTLTATTGMDTLTHAIEAYIGNAATKKTQKDALEAARLVAENLEPAYHHGKNLKYRANMLRASFLAGRAFSKAFVGYCHAVAHSLGGKYNIPHGLANAVLLPYVLEAYGSAIYKKSKDIAVAMHLVDENENEEIAAKVLIETIRIMNKNMGIPEKLGGIHEKDIPKLAAYAAKEANPTYPVPVLMGRKELEKFYYCVMA